ncbi:hypothetical protein [Actinomadura keratinilytica]|uniref:hypothetical protein n=1 Tax=Actinomadura keratinilytica TaxID=547461 RepID=UPI0031ED0E89
MVVECGRPRSDFGSTCGAGCSDGAVCAIVVSSAGRSGAAFSAAVDDRVRVARGLAAVAVRRVVPALAVLALDVPAVLRAVLVRDEAVDRRAVVVPVVPRRVPVVAALARDVVERDVVERDVVPRPPVVRPVVERPVVERPVVARVLDVVDRRPAVVPAVGGLTLVMAVAAELIALAASAIAFVAVVIALVMAVMALADEDALDATDLIWVAADLACVAAWVTLLAAAVCVRLAPVAAAARDVVRDVPARDVEARDVADLRAVVVRRVVPVDRDVVPRRAAVVPVPRRAVAVVRDAVARAALVRLAAVFAAVFAAPVAALARLVAPRVALLAALVALFVALLAALFVRPAVPRLDAVRDAVLVATDLPPVMISCGGTIPLLVGLYTPSACTLSENVRLKRVRRPPDATPSWSPGTRSGAACPGRRPSRRRSGAARA